MRLISQDKYIDIPYETVGVAICAKDDRCIVALSMSDPNEEYAIPLGVYSSNEKALKVMAKMHKHYRYNGKNFTFPLDSEVAK